MLQQIWKLNTNTEWVIFVVSLKCDSNESRMMINSVKWKKIKLLIIFTPLTLLEHVHLISIMNTDEHEEK